MRCRKHSRGIPEPFHVQHPQHRDIQGPNVCFVGLLPGLEHLGSHIQNTPSKGGRDDLPVTEAKVSELELILAWP